MLSINILLLSSCVKEESRIAVLPFINPLLNENKAGIIKGIYEKVYKDRELKSMATILKQGDIVVLLSKDVFITDKYSIPLFLISDLDGNKIGYINALSLELSSTIETAKTYLKYITDNTKDNLWLF